MGLMSAAKTTTECGGLLEEEEEVVELLGGDLRRDLTTSLTPRLSVLALFAVFCCQTDWVFTSALGRQTLKGTGEKRGERARRRLSPLPPIDG